MEITENFLSLSRSLAITNAAPQKTANMLGKRTTAIGIKKIVQVSATIKAVPIQYKPIENQPNPRTQAAKKVFKREGVKLIK